MWSMSVTTGSIVDRAVDRPQLARGRLGLGQVVGHVLLVEEHLALEVVGLDEVAVDDADRPDARAGEVVGQHGTERPAAAERDPAFQQGTLARLAELRKADLPAVAVERLGGTLAFSVHVANGSASGHGGNDADTSSPGGDGRGQVSR